MHSSVHHLWTSSHGGSKGNNEQYFIMMHATCLRCILSFEAFQFCHLHTVLENSPLSNIYCIVFPLLPCLLFCTLSISPSVSLRLFHPSAATITSLRRALKPPLSLSVGVINYLHSIDLQALNTLQLLSHIAQGGETRGRAFYERASKRGENAVLSKGHRHHRVSCDLFITEVKTLLCHQALCVRAPPSGLPQ